MKGGDKYLNIYSYPILPPLLKLRRRKRMSRQKSSNITHVKDALANLNIAIIDLEKEFLKLMSNSERLKEIEPALRKLQAALSPVALATTTPTEPETEPHCEISTGANTYATLIPLLFPPKTTNKRIRHAKGNTEDQKTSTPA